jgi:hypothetical protein
MTKVAAALAGLGAGIVTAIIIILMTSALDGVVDARKGWGSLLVFAIAAFALVLSGGLGIAVYRHVEERLGRSGVWGDFWQAGSSEPMTAPVAILLAAILASAVLLIVARYELSTSGNGVWRLDRWTGAVSICAPTGCFGLSEKSLPSK